MHVRLTTLWAASKDFEQQRVKMTGLAACEPIENRALGQLRVCCCVWQHGMFSIVGSQLCNNLQYWHGRVNTELGSTEP
eukprot:6192767-Pleurochrysis_carterae.AAC.1